MADAELEASTDALLRITSSANVAAVRPGDRVTVPTHICCGFCASCVSGRSAECLMTNPGQAGAAYGYPGMRLDKAGEMGFQPIDFSAGDPVEQILDARRRMRGRSGAWRGEEALIGVTCGIDARQDGYLKVVLQPRT